MKNSLAVLVVASFLAPGVAVADQAGRKHAENELHARPAVHVTVGVRDADITGSDNRQTCQSSALRLGQSKGWVSAAGREGLAEATAIKILILLG